MMRESAVTRWFRRRHRAPTPPQRAAWPLIEAGRSVLVLSPTGTGKTLAAFLAVLNDLALQAEEAGQVSDGIQALYVSPLRALGYDLEKNLRGPLQEIYGEPSPIRVGLRSGDTSMVERQRQAARPPHILLTTPESLLILLSQPRWLPALARVRWVIVDEVHALAESKRGTHLALSLERLDCLRSASGSRPLQRIGLSATVASPDAVGAFLAGAGRGCEIVDVTAGKRVRIDVHSPLGRDPYPPAGFTGIRLMRDLAGLIRRHRTTLVFSNTRSGAESATYWLREALPDLAEAIECHHASLDRDVRLEVEDRLKRGELRAVVCSTSLELGIDIGAIDLVVMLATPKGVGKALQRAGRSGHNLRRISRGILMATNLHDLVECCATASLARARHLEEARIPVAPLDVLAQHLVSMGCVARWSRAEAFDLVRRAAPYRDLDEAAFTDVLDYLAGGGASLRRQYSELFGRIELDEDGFETRAGRVQRDFLQNAGVIPSTGSVTVRLRRGVLGSVEEGFIRQLRPGDVFMLSGRPVRLLRSGVMEAFVERAEGAVPTVPRWNANKMPLSNRVAAEILRFRRELRARFEAEGTAVELHAAWIARMLQCGEANARIIHRMHEVQHRVSEIPTDAQLLVEVHEAPGVGGEPQAPEARGRRRGRPAPRTEGGARHYFFHSLIGRAANDALARVVALRLSRLRGGNAVATPDDYGFVLTVAASEPVAPGDLARLLVPEGFAEDLSQGLRRSELLKYHFRNAAQTGLMVYRNYFGERKSVRRLQWSAEVIFNVLVEHEPEHVLLREACRDAVHTFLDVDGALAYLQRMEGRPVRVQEVPRVPPLSFAMYASRIREVLLLEEPRETLERLYHLWWNQLEYPGAQAESEPERCS